jgi:thiamine-phosphate pyrophosphorylase
MTMTDIDLYVVAEHSIFETDEAWLAALGELAALDTRALAIQVRCKHEPPERAEELAGRARSVLSNSKPPVLLNGSSDEALRHGYPGVQWPEALIPDAAQNDSLLRGASVHSPEAAKRAEAAGAHFLIAGTIFDAGSKPVAGQGVDLLRVIVRATSLPVLSIGGITPHRVADCVEAGARGIAVVSSVLSAPNIAAAVDDLRSALDEACVPSSPLRSRRGPGDEV